MPDGDTLLVIWLKLLILAGTINDGGAIYLTPEIPYTDHLLSTQFARPLPTVQLALRTFESFGMIEVVGDVLQVSNWEKYQNTEGLEKIREQTRKRVANYRTRQKLIEGNVTQCSVTDRYNVTQCNATDKNKKENKKENIEDRRFTPPTIEDVEGYIKQQGYSVDAEAFVDYYGSQKWKKANGRPVTDWKACLRTWERKDKERNAPQKTTLEQLWGDRAK